jgi:4-hydroxybenzoate polyprenyltransferase
MADFINDIIRYIRLKDWWSFIIPPVMSFYCIGLLTTYTGSQPFANIAFRFICFLMLTILVAAFGFLLNEWMDKRDDKIAGKKNALEGVAAFKVWLLFVFILSGIIAISLVIHWHHSMQWLLALQLLLFIFYSVYPFRLKRKKYAAVILDSIYSGTLFYIIAVVMGGAATANRFPPIPVLFLWGFCRGLRNIVYHQLQDSKHDRKAGLHTLAHDATGTSIRKKLVQIVLPLEISSYFLLLYYSPYNLFFGASYLVFLLYLAFRREYIIPFILKRKSIIQVDIVTEINLYYELIMPLVSFALLVVNDFRLIVLFCLYLALFPAVFKWARHLYLQSTAQ